MMDIVKILLLVVGSLFALFMTGVAGYIAWEFFKSWRLKKKLHRFVFDHKMMLNGNNRFIADYDTIRKAFPGYSELALVMAWESLVKDGMIKKDELDGEWVIK